MRKINSMLRNLLADEEDIDCEDYEYYYDDDGIEELDFSVRTYNCLRRAGITTVSQLKQMTIDDLKKKVESLEKLKNSLKVDNQRLTEDRKILIRKVNELDNRLANVSLWDLSPEQQEAAGHALANDLLGKNR